MSATQVFYQEVDLSKILDTYAKGFQPPNNGVVLKWDVNVDHAKGKVWFKLFVEMPEPESKNIITLNG